MVGHDTEGRGFNCRYTAINFNSRRFDHWQWTARHRFAAGIRRLIMFSRFFARKYSISVCFTYTYKITFT